jgi:hypothetical protein
MADQCRIRQDGDHVIINFKGAESRVPYSAALQLAAYIRQEAKKAEDFAKQNQMIADDLLMKRSGLPQGLTMGAVLRRLFKREQ